MIRQHVVKALALRDIHGKINAGFICRKLGITLSLSYRVIAEIEKLEFKK
jgi:hypothetical protein